jgi:ribonuclease HI
MSKFYAVRVGRLVGIFDTWVECKNQVNHFPGAQFKSFKSRADAEEYLSPSREILHNLQAEKEKGPLCRENYPEEEVTTEPLQEYSFAQVDTANEIEESLEKDWLNVFLCSYVKPRLFASTCIWFGPDDSRNYSKILDPKTSAEEVRLLGLFHALERCNQPGRFFLNITSHLNIPSELRERFEGAYNKKKSFVKIRVVDQFSQGIKCATKILPFPDLVWKIFIDGSCVKNGPNSSSGGIGVWFGPDDPRNLSEPLQGDQTNNRAELTAMLRALHCCMNINNAEILTDSKYVKDGLETWIHTWKKNGWKTAKKTKVLNSDLWCQLYSLYLMLHGRVKIIYVPAHCGIHGNEMADTLAKRASGIARMRDQESNPKISSDAESIEIEAPAWANRLDDLKINAGNSPPKAKDWKELFLNFHREVTGATTMPCNEGIEIVEKITQKYEEAYTTIEVLGFKQYEALIGLKHQPSTSATSGLIKCFHCNRSEHCAISCTYKEIEGNKE